MQGLLTRAGFHIVGKVSKTFTPQGFTVLFLLCESHLAIHTFPEENQTYIELSSCNKQYFDNFKQDIQKTPLQEQEL
jgi:S-adenosylmethionine decarboxylase